MEPDVSNQLAGLRDEVQVLFDWDRLDGLVTRGSVLYDPWAAAMWWTPWYVHDGVQVGYDHPRATGVRVGHAGVHPGLDQARRARIAALADGPMGRFTVVTYRWHGPNRIVMDGNHRLAAAVLARRPAVIDVITITGPCDPGQLADCLPFLRRPTSRTPGCST